VVSSTCPKPLQLREECASVLCVRVRRVAPRRDSIVCVADGNGTRSLHRLYVGGGGGVIGWAIYGRLYLGFCNQDGPISAFEERSVSLPFPHRPSLGGLGHTPPPFLPRTRTPPPHTHCACELRPRNTPRLSLSRSRQKRLHGKDFCLVLSRARARSPPPDHQRTTLGSRGSHDLQLTRIEWEDRRASTRG
jgi:hypothetical protein